MSSSPRCRIYFFTYNRNRLMARAINSLLGQTLTDWVCEVHNDNPADPFPGTYIRSLNDQRFTVHDHPVNFGAVKTFNFAFVGCPEPFAAILEDDNWWEPAFLKEMVELLETQKDAEVAWSNMNLWEELPGNGWRNTHKTTWPVSHDIARFRWPSVRQAISGLHSNSSLIYRGGSAANYAAPESSLLNAIELIRERSFAHPIYLNHKPLANFAVTLSTNRSNNRYTWIATQCMLLASFVSAADKPAKTFKESLRYFRQQKPSPVAVFFLSISLLLKNRTFYRYFSFADWIAIGKWLLKHGYKISFLKKYLRSQAEVYGFLLQNTAKRYQENHFNHENSDHC